MRYILFLFVLSCCCSCSGHSAKETAETSKAEVSKADKTEMTKADEPEVETNASETLQDVSKRIPPESMNNRRLMKLHSVHCIIMN